MLADCLGRVSGRLYPSYQKADGRSVTSALVWMFMFTGSPTDWGGTNHLLRHPNKPGVYITSHFDYSR
jgi:hypothetical protein